MTIADKLTYLNETKQAIKQAIIDKGVEVADTDTFRNYANKIGEISASEDGFYLKRTYTLTSNGTLTEDTNYFNLTLPSQAKSINCNVLRSSYQNMKNLRNVNLSNIETIGSSGDLNSAFQYCTGLKTVDFSGLTTNNSTHTFYYLCRGCTSLESINFHNLKKATAWSMMYLCSGCTALNSVDFSSLEEVNGSQALDRAFENCTSLKNISFPSLTADGVGTGAYGLSGMLRGVTGCTVHLPSDLKDVIGSSTTITNGFGGTSTTVLFDIHRISDEGPEQDEQL